MRLKTFPGGVHPRDSKHYSNTVPISLAALPSRVIIPLSQHIGGPSTPIVKVGDEVLAGQRIAEASGFVSIHQHASISGKITKIEKFPHPVGNKQLAIEITGDGQDNWVDLVDEPNYLSFTADELKSRITEAGICGMGGAGFPTQVKLSPPPEKKIDTVILNGVECEPFLTSDHRLMLEHPDEIIAGLKAIMKICGASNGIIGIEANKPDAIELFEKKLSGEKSLSVVALMLQYPQGAEKQLIYAATRRRVPNKGGLPMEVGVVVQNVGTAYAIHEACRYKEPLVERIITSSGPIVKQPANFRARVGTLYCELLEQSGGTSEEIAKVVSGGPMMGFAIPTCETPMTKGSSGVLVFGAEDARHMEEHECLRCARCVDVCPLNLMPSMIAQSVKYKDLDMAVKAGLNDCMKCGSCAYVCPAQIRLVQWIDTGKLRWAEQQRQKK